MREDNRSGGLSRNCVEEIAEEFLERRRRGESPDVCEYEAKHPQMAEEIRRFLSAVVAMESLAGKSVAGAGSGGSPVPCDALPRQGQLGEFRILREVGRGGMGVVYEALQEPLNRRVALKVLPHHALMDARSLERFRLEAQAAARLHHRGIVPVFGSGEHEGLHFYSMQFIEGITIADVLVELRGMASRRDVLRSLGARACGEAPAASRQGGCAALDLMRKAMQPGSSALPLRGSEEEYCFCVARLGKSAAEALAYAHSEGVLHRDVKPSNLLLDGEGCLWLADFGLAKIQGAAEVTGAGDVVGTLRYLAPERLKGWADPRSDVYSLGLTLYELLTLHSPFDDADRGRVLRRIVDEDPPRPRKLAKGIPVDLETIVLKCIAKEPGQRYATAGSLHEDLRRFLAGEPIQARMTGTLERGLKWAKRRPAAAGLVAVTLAALVVGLAGTLWYNALLSEAALKEKAQRQVASARESEALAAKALAEERESTANRYLHGAHMNLAVQAWEAGLVSRMVDLLKRQVPAPESPDYRGFEWYHLWRLSHRESACLYGHTGEVHAVAFSSDGRRLASGGEDRSVRVWDLATGELEHYYEEHKGPIRSLAFSPDGKTLAAASGDRTVSIWDFDKARVKARFLGHAEAVTGVAFSPDGTLAASSSQDWTVRFWDPETCEEKVCYRLKAGTVNCVAFSPNGARVAAGYVDGRIHVLEAPSGKVLATLGPLGASASCVAFSPDGGLLAAGSMFESTPLSPGEVRVWDAASFKQKAVLFAKDGASITSLAFISSDASTLATAGYDKLVRRWDWARGEAKRPLRGVLGTIFALAYSASSGRLATGDFTGVVKLWNPSVIAEAEVLKGHSAEVMCVAFSPDGKRAISASRDDTARIWDLEHGEEWAVLEGHENDVISACFSPDGRLAATGSMDRTARVWDAESGALRMTLKGHTGFVLGACFSPDGKMVATGSADRLIKLWSAATGEELGTLRGHLREVRSVVFGPHSESLASVSGDWGDWSRPAELKVWAVAQRAERLSVTGAHSQLAGCIAFSHDGKRLATGGPDSRIKVWDASSGEPRGELTGHSMGVTGLAFLPGDEALVSSSWDRTVKLWDLKTREERATFRQDIGALTCIAVSPNGNTVLAGGTGGIEILRAEAQGVVEARLREEASWNNAAAGGTAAPAGTAAGLHRGPQAPIDAEHRGWLHQCAAQALERGGSLEKAMAEYIRALEEDALFLPASRAMGRLLDESGPRCLAAGAANIIGTVEKLQAAGRADARLLRALAAALLAGPATGSAHDALRYATLATDMTERKDAPALFTLADAQLRNGRPADAVLTLEEASRLAPSERRIEDRLETCRHAARPDYPSYASIDAAFEEAPAALIPRGAAWKLFKGTAEPSPGLEWTREDFDDSSWESGPSGFGYADGDDATVLADMKDKYTTVYLRRAFAAPAAGLRVAIEVMADDGYIAYLNGREVARQRAGPTAARLPFQATAEAPAPEPLVAHSTEVTQQLRAGTNLLAIQGLNASLNSSDFSLIPVLRVLPDSGAWHGDAELAAFRAVAKGESAARRVAYFEGRLLARDQRHLEATRKFLEAADGQMLDARPHIRLAESFRAAGEPARAESHLREALAKVTGGTETLWDLWFLVACVDLDLPAAKVLDRLPGTWRDGERRAVDARADRIWALESLRATGCIRINCGGDAYTNPKGVSWGKDRFFAPCSVGSKIEPGQTYLYTEERFEGDIMDTDEDPLYYNERWFPVETCRDSGYRIPVPAGKYRVTLHSAEIVFTPRGARVFDVEIEGMRVLTGYEPRAAGMATADRRTFETVVRDGILDIVFLHRVENPDISAIEVELVE